MRCGRSWLNGWLDYLLMMCREDIKLLPKTPSAKSRTRRGQRKLRSNAAGNNDVADISMEILPAKKTRHVVLLLSSVTFCCISYCSWILCKFIFRCWLVSWAARCPVYCFGLGARYDSCVTYVCICLYIFAIHYSWHPKCVAINVKCAVYRVSIYLYLYYLLDIYITAFDLAI